MASTSMAKLREDPEAITRRQNTAVPDPSNVSTSAHPVGIGMVSVTHSETTGVLGGRRRRQEFPTEWTMCVTDEEGPGVDLESDEQAHSSMNDWSAQGD